MRYTCFATIMVAATGLAGCAGRSGDGAMLAADRFDTETRPQEVVAELDAYNAGLTEDQRTGKYCKMAESPFTFYRGTNHLFWRDFAGDTRFARFSGTRTRIFLQGDLHANNFGSYDNDDGIIVFGLNDFDEVVIADYQWDLWRLAVSLVLIAEQNGGFSGTAIDSFVETLAESYLDALAAYRGNDDETKAIHSKDTTYGLLDDFLRDVEDSESREEMLRKWTAEEEGALVFDLTLDDLGPAEPDIVAEITAAVPSYIALTGGALKDIPGYFTIKDIARRLNAGIGSFGTPRYYMLIEGDSADPDDDRILDIKRQGEPSAYPYLVQTERDLLARAATSHGERAVVGYRALLANADDHLGWMTLSDGVYSVRERSPYKELFPVENLTSADRFTKLAEQWGAILASSHARADKDYKSTIFDYSFDKEVDVLTDGKHSAFRAQVRDIARSYAAQVGRDYQTFLDALAPPQGCSGLEE